MRSKGTRSVLSILKSTNNYLLIAITFFIIVVMLACAIILYQSHITVCELFNTKMETTGVSIARELALGEKAVAANLFENLVGSFRKVGSEVDLQLKDLSSNDMVSECKARITNAEISHVLSFSGDRVGIVQGEITSFKLSSIILFIFFIATFLFLILKFVKNKLIQNIRDQIVIPIELLCTQELIIQDNLPDEVKNIAKKLNILKDSISLSEKAKQDISNAEKVSNIATQVAHDIRSPLEVLKSINSELELLPSDTRRMVQLSITRIEEIAFNLLKNHKKSMTLLQARQPEELLSLIKGVILEKKIEFRNKSSIEIIELYNTDSYGLFSIVQRNNLKNIISNLVNNGIESIEDENGRIAIELKSIDDKNVITIEDSGSGIPDAIKDKIFTKGFTTKRSGNGIGLHNAKQDIEALGGTIRYESQLGLGTIFTITLPTSQTSPRFIDAIHSYNYDKIIILDDDPAFHEVWNKKLDNLESKIEHFHSVEELFSKYQSLHAKILLLSDFELMDKYYDGIDIILKLNHASHSVLVTARSEDNTVQERCLADGIKLLPKSLVNYIKVFKSASNSNQIREVERYEGRDVVFNNNLPTCSPVILIDDDHLVHINWARYCKKKSIPFYGYKSVNEFIVASIALDKTSRIYVDSSLGDGIVGEVESIKIFDLGFKNLYLATGFEMTSIQKPTWIKEIFSKSPENIF